MRLIARITATLLVAIVATAASPVTASAEVIWGM